MSQPNMVTFTEQDLKNVKRLYEAAVRSGEKSFWYRDNEYLTSYAKYLIEYLEGQFGVAKEKVMSTVKQCYECNYTTNIVGDMAKHRREKHDMRRN